MERKTTSGVDVVQLAQHLSRILSRAFVSARMIDRGSYATVYQLIDAPLSSASTSTDTGSQKRNLPAVIVRVSSRPVYNDVAIDEERLKIRTFVATMNLIHDSAPKQIRRNVPRILAYDTSATTKFGLGWVAMTRLAGSTLADCWTDFGVREKKKVIEDLAGFTRKLARSTSQDHIGSIAVTERSWSRGPTPHTWTSLSIPRRRGANNLRPYDFAKKCQHPSSWSFLHEAIESEIAFLRTHQRSAVRCFNMNMVRLRQCGMEDEIPIDASFASTTSAVYRKQLRALADLARTVIETDEDDEERFVLAHLHLVPENILVDPESGALTGIVDWEFAGFVPEWIALAPPAWISDEWLPSWSEENGWATEEGDACEDPEVVAQLQELWEKTVSWDMLSVTDCGSVIKRKMWKACLSEWHELERASAWARGVVCSRLQPSFMRIPHSTLPRACSESEDSYLDSDQVARCHSPSTAESSTGPFTPVDAVHTLDLPPWRTTENMKSMSKSFEYPTYPSDQNSVEDDGYDEESENGDNEEDEFEDDALFEQFALSFAPPPLPHNSSLVVKVTQASPTMTTFIDLSSPQHFSRSLPSPVSHVMSEDIDFARSMNSNAPPSRLPSTSIWCAFWETPRVDVSRDLDFVVERDLDAGW
ncbi:hypothetical protein FRC14_002656 [Serendipita sp. 396]|nr:hypothetical protein FRC14_002656 [Serendipita sp. 396]KAG8784582.1 hypothetical protein FRC15_003033 [Serendipita sp. 397]KAG8800194.1 hypothetical protein FRC16_003443 [Serendipita sp. 398]KAG8868277.1 hypothetical protein FRC20_003708 [Serendipita sp. 405]